MCYNNSTVKGESGNRSKKILKKFKNPLTNNTKCVIIITENKGADKPTKQKKEFTL